jgi:hypothetical protein
VIRRERRIVATVCAALVAAACARPARAPRKTHLARLPAGTEEVAIADDAATYAYVEKDGDHARVVRNGIADRTTPGSPG